MNLFPQEKTHKNISLILFSLASLVLLSGCPKVTIPVTEVCTVAGTLRAGADCAYTPSKDQTVKEMSFDEFIDFLEPQPERPDPNDPTKTLPARAGAICQSASDWNKLKTALESACHILKKKCTYEIKESIAQLGQAIEKLEATSISKKRKK